MSEHFLMFRHSDTVRYSFIHSYIHVFMFVVFTQFRLKPDITLLLI